MPLLSFWKNAREEVLNLNVEQVVSSAGDGNLRDNAQSSEEFRQFLNVVPVEKLFDYARHCLESAFNKNARSHSVTAFLQPNKTPVNSQLP
jgi:phosphoenolpyruvate synthase/pyruvate phosphate dikinase